MDPKFSAPPQQYAAYGQPGAPMPAMPPPPPQYGMPPPGPYPPPPYGAPPPYPPPGQYPAPYAPPPMMDDMNRLSSMSTMLVAQELQLSMLLQMAGVPWEPANRFKVSPVPHGVAAACTTDDPKRWIPSSADLKNAPLALYAMEESDCCLRILLTAIGGLNLRPYIMHFLAPDGREVFKLDRPCKMGGCCCCPLEQTLIQNGQPQGRAEELYDNYCRYCCEGMWCCTSYTRVLEGPHPGQERHLYTLKASLCCCGGHNNCCGATCCKDALVMDIMDPNGNVVGHIHKTFGKTDGANCCRAAAEVGTYIVDLPAGATEMQRQLMLAGLMNIVYQLFEQKGGDNGGGGGGGGGGGN